jgi:hypothetical protein
MITEIISDIFTAQVQVQVGILLLMLVLALYIILDTASISTALNLLHVYVDLSYKAIQILHQASKVYISILAFSFIKLYF